MAAAVCFTLVPFKKDDYQDFRALTQSDSVMEMITGGALSEAESQAHFEKILQQNQVAPGFGNFRIIDIDNNAFIGLAKLVMETAADKEVEIGFMLTAPYQGQGIATEATRRLIEVASAQKNLTRVKAILDPQNKASRKILISQGFVSEFVGEIDGLPGEVMSLVL